MKLRMERKAVTGMLGLAGAAVVAGAMLFGPKMFADNAAATAADESNGKVTRYFLASDFGDLDVSNDRVVVIGKGNGTPFALGTGAWRCGDTDHAGIPTDDPNFNTTNSYSSFSIWLSGNDSKAGRVPRLFVWGQGVSLNPGVKGTSIAVANGGETCTETVDGVAVTFKKYSMTSDDSKDAAELAARAAQAQEAAQ